MNFFAASGCGGVFQQRQRIGDFRRIRRWHFMGDFNFFGIAASVFIDDARIPRCRIPRRQARRGRFRTDDLRFDRRPELQFFEISFRVSPAGTIFTSPSAMCWMAALVKSAGE